MKTSDEIDQLATALCAAQAEMPNAIYNRVNPHFRSQYADLAAIREASLPALTKNGLSIVQTTCVTAVGFVLFSRLMHKSGQWIEGEWPITLGSPQSMGSQLTYFRRYLWSGQTGVAADDDDDANVAEATARHGQGASDVTLGQETLSKAKSRPVYDSLVKDMRACTSKGELTGWGLENANRIYSMHADFQRWFRDDYAQRLTAIAEGVDEEGNEVKQDSEFKRQLRDSLEREIDDEIPAEGGGDEAA
jgi:hypothetical protein